MTRGPFDPGQPVDYPLPVTRSVIDDAAVERGVREALAIAPTLDDTFTELGIRHLIRSVLQAATGMAPEAAGPPLSQAEADLEPDDVVDATVIDTGQPAWCAVCVYIAQQPGYHLARIRDGVTILGGTLVCADHLYHLDRADVTLLAHIAVDLPKEGPCRD